MSSLKGYKSDKKWQYVSSSDGEVYKFLEIRSGWLVRISNVSTNGVGLTFVPDPEHKNLPIPLDAKKVN